MKKVFQTIVDKDHGNCMQAAIASLFDLELDDVPNFIEEHEWHRTMRGFLFERGYDSIEIHRNHGRTSEWLKDLAKFDNGVNGYLYATVPSRTYKNGLHAVIINTNLEVIHDPNPNQMCLDIMPDEIISIMVMHDMICGKTGKFFTPKDWNNATEEERDLNTYQVSE